MTREEYLKRKIYIKQQTIMLIQDEVNLLRTELKQCQGPQKNAADPKPSYFEIPIVGGELFPVYREDVNVWAEAYPGVDVLASLRNMKQWCLSNPKKQKTRKGCRRFITGWLAREQDKPKKHIAPGEQIDTRPKLFPAQGGSQ